MGEAEACEGNFCRGHRKNLRGLKLTENESRFSHIRFKLKKKFAQKKYDRLKNLEKSFSFESFFLKLSGGVNNCVLGFLCVIMTLFALKYKAVV